MYVFELIGDDDAFAAYEASALASQVTRVAPGIVTADALSTHVDQLAFTRSILRRICRTSPSVDALADGLRDCAFERQGSAAVRARAIREAEIDTQAVERRLGAVLADRGFEIDLDTPDRVLRVLVSTDIAFAGWIVTEPGGDVGRRRPTDRPFFQPGSMSPRLARALVNIGGIHPGRTMVDPMCGTGGILLEAARVGADAIGIDIQDRMVRGTQRNFAAIDAPGTVRVIRGDASHLPIRGRGVDAVVFDAPYGRQSKIAGSELLEAALTEASRITTCAVVVADRPIAHEATQRGWMVEQSFARRVHRSLIRHIAHLRC